MRRYVALAAASVLAVGGALVAAVPSTAEEGTVDVGGLPTAGSVVFQSGLPGGVGRFTTTVDDGVETTVQTQDVSNNTCDVLETGPVEVTSNGKACFRNLGYGVNPGRDGLSWFQNFLNPNTKAGEVLGVSITTEDVFFLGDVSLDIEAVSTNGGPLAIQLVTWLGETQQEVIDVPLGNQVVGWPPNFRETATLTKAADRITFTALGATRFQLEGDTNGRQGSTFPLVRGTDVVECGGAPIVLENGASLSVGGDGCTPEPVVFDINDQGEVLLLKEPSDAEYTLRLPFEDGEDPLARVKVDYDVDGPSEYQDVDFCGGSTESPVLLKDENPLTVPADPADWDGFCEAGRAYVIVDGAFRVDVILFGVNDPKFRYR